jgi:adenine-specific DNA-methyltransferase
MVHDAGEHRAERAGLQPELTGTSPPGYLDHPALKRALITYIGNKRTLIPFIDAGIDRIAGAIGPLTRMADPFTGSGVVARLGRLRGMKVIAGDIEDYTIPGGRAFLEVTPGEVDGLFPDTGGYLATLGYLNRLTAPHGEWDRLFSRHYAPASTETADPERERLFYTRENASRIDAILAAVHRDLPMTYTGRAVILAGLLVEMSVHINTSGVMKGFHHGWGGRGGDALSRILAPIELAPLPFIDGPGGTVRCGDAADVLVEAAGEHRRGRGERPAFDLVYIDPPYNIHQYGANYHLLTTAVRWDFYDPGPVARGSRAGIRRDHYRSEFARRSGTRAATAFQQVLDAADTKALLVSYNNDGIMSPREILEMLSEDGINTVELMRREHVKFRGGKATQSAATTDEFLYVVYRGKRQSRRERLQLRSTVEEMTVTREIVDRFVIPSRWEGEAAANATRSRGPMKHHPTGAVVLTTPGGSRITLSREFRVEGVEIGEIDAGEAEAVTQAVRGATGTVVDVMEEMIAYRWYHHAIVFLQRLKIRKYRGEFERFVGVLRESPLTPAERKRLEQLVARVTG